MKPIRLKEANQRELNNLEGYLDRALQPVTPRAEFVHTLRDKLSRVEIKAEKDILEKEPRALHFALLGGAGILSSLLLVITSVRAVIALIAALKQIRQRLEVKPSVTAPTTAQ
jgi:hypothetical protein